MPNIVILSHWRVGSTNFKKTLEQITGQEFWNEPNFKKHKNTIDSMGFNEFMEKSKWKSMKCDYVKSKDYLNEILDYADMVFLLKRRDVTAQANSYGKLLNTILEKEDARIWNHGVSKLSIREIKEANDLMTELVKKHPNHRILWYEDITDILSRKEDE
jgi:hypothetical protein|tara:strand:+ start:202 stop:678 length:477 start_codon:yes stop_codon:yes gene_type:complete